jgi:hypothetical protein
VTDEPLAPPQDDKDWTWVLHEPCPECGFDAAALDRGDIPGLVRASAANFAAALARRDAAARREPHVWSALEYGCHVRDVCRVFNARLERMLTEDDPLFANWDQDETALTERYWAQDPATVAAELTESADAIAQGFAAVDGDQWQRPSRRSNGSVFTVDSFGRYFMHDLVHHVHDVHDVHDISG